MIPPLVAFHNGYCPQEYFMGTEKGLSNFFLLLSRRAALTMSDFGTKKLED